MGRIKSQLFLFLTVLAVFLLFKFGPGMDLIAKSADGVSDLRTCVEAQLERDAETASGNASAQNQPRDDCGSTVSNPSSNSTVQRPRP